MQFIVFSIPVLGGDAEAAALNRFLRGHKILHVEQQLAQFGQAAFWTFSVKYLADAPTGQPFLPKKDFRETLDEASFARFARLREIRKGISKAEVIPAYAVFTDEELANLAKLDELTAASMRSVKGIGEKKVEKYADRFLAELAQKP